MKRAKQREIVETLVSISARLDRALQQLRRFDRSLKAFVDRTPYVAEFSEGHCRLRIEQHPPIQLGLMLGDAVHNLRSSLDHLAWQLALRGSGPPSPKTSFPIMTSAKKAIPNLTLSMLTVFDRLKADRAAQPLDLLKTLDRLWNTDKHRDLNVVAEAFDCTYFFSDEDALPFMTRITGLVDGDILPDPPQGVPARVKVRPALEIRTEDYDPAVFIVLPPETMHEIYSFVRFDVVPRFSGLLK